MVNGKNGSSAFVFDCVCHIFNFDLNNAYGPPGQLFINHLYAFHKFLTAEGETVLPPEQFMREWSVDEIYEMIINNSDTDMIIAQPLPPLTSLRTVSPPGKNARPWPRNILIGPFSGVRSTRWRAKRPWT
jgi:hypothetical protein